LGTPSETLLDGVDPAQLIERDLANFAKPGLGPDLVKMAHDHHKMKRVQKIETLLKERSKLPEDFEPPQAIFAASRPTTVGNDGWCSPCHHTHFLPLLFPIHSYPG
jgi:hypothetical protein